jgi:ferric-dicitrate binding protein FerR (iron transport regulator)/predicted transcriptional regulator
MHDIQRLISGYLDNELTDAELDRLADLLQADKDAVTRFAISSFVHSHLNEWMDQRRVQDDALAGLSSKSDAPYGRSRFSDTRNSVDAILCDCPELGDDWEGAAGLRRFWPRSIASRAAALLVAAAVAFAAYAVATRPVAVAQLTQATGCQWDTSLANPQVGALLNNGQQLQLIKGKALITLVGGAQVFLEAPTSVRLDSVNQVHLDHGQLAAKVPTPAKGFTVSTSLAQFVDWGTMFTLKLDDKAFDLYVFEGLVEVQVDKRFGERSHRPMWIPEAHAVQFDTQAPEVVGLPFNQGEKMPF